MMLDNTSRFHGANYMMQILAVWRVVINMVETLVVLWKVLLVGLSFPTMMRRLKCRQGVGGERCEGRGRRRCGMGNWGLVGELMKRWMGWLGGG